MPAIDYVQQCQAITDGTKKWYDGLKRCGLYYERFVDGEKVAECLENHRRETTSIFETRSSRSAACKTSAKDSTSQSATENVRNNNNILFYDKINK